MDPKRHWEQVYRTKKPDEVSWYRPHLETSLELIVEAVPNHRAHIVDVGGGESTLVDDLLHLGYQHLTVLDVSTTALDVARARIGAQGSNVNWLCGDVRTVELAAHQHDLWHDRAVFHFLTDPDDRAAYVRQVGLSLKPGGHVIVATFGPEGPTECSGLEVSRYNAEALHDEFGAQFELLRHRIDFHQTPGGSVQQFVYCFCKVVGK